MTDKQQIIQGYCHKCGKPTKVNDSNYPTREDHGTLWPLRRNSICAEAFVVNEEGKVLLIKRATQPMVGNWALPGGFSQYSEHPSGTAVREVLEETGWKIRLTGEILGVYMDSFPNDASSEHRVVVTYLAQPIEDIGGVLDGEIQSYGWFDVNDLPNPTIAIQINRFIDYKKRMTN